MKRIYGIVAAVIVVVCAVFIGLAPRHYETKEACLEREIGNRRIVLQVKGIDSELVCYETLTDGELTMIEGILHAVGNQWGFYEYNLMGSYKFEMFYVSKTITGYLTRLKGSEDQYIFLTDGPSYSSSNEMDVKKWNMKDNLESKFYCVDTYDSGSEKTYYIARVPANTTGYTLQFGKWIIRDLDLNQPWNETEAKVELIEDVGGLS